MKVIIKTAVPIFLILQMVSVFAQSASDSEALQKDLRSSYAILQKAISDGSLAGFINAKIPNPDSAKVTEAQFREALQVVRQMYPVMDAKDFLEVKRSGDIAGYYYLSNEDGENFVSVKLIKFKNVKGIWKVGDTASSSAPLASKDSEKAQIRKMIDTSSTLKLDK